MLAFSIAATKPSYKDGRYEGCGKTGNATDGGCPAVAPQRANQQPEYFSCFCVELTGGEKSFLKLALEQKQEKLDFLGVLSVGP